VSAGARRVAVVSGDPLPLRGFATSGAGLRAWQLGQGLIARGHNVTFLMPDSVRAKYPDLPHEGALYYQAGRLADRVRELAPDVLVFQHWSQVGQVGDLDIPVALDLHGPVLLEIVHEDSGRERSLVPTKLRAFQRADFLTCAGVRQRAYFYAWALLAGHDMRANPIAVVPVALAPDLPARRPDGDVTFVFGGVLLPWQDPSAGLIALVETLEARGRGRLKLFSGPHAVQSVAAERQAALLDRLAASPRVERPGLVAHAEMLEAYLSATAAFDLMAPNPEREMAFTTRTVEYLWCGLPVIYNNYAELAEYIGDYNAGWTVDPGDSRAIKSVVEAILDAPGEVAERGRNAQRLVRERLNWEVAIEPLDQFCRSPRRRAAHGEPLLQDSDELLAHLRERDRQLAHLTAEIERKNRHILELESLIERLQSGRLMRFLQLVGRR
jgi:hypothetical protein